MALEERIYEVSLFTSDNPNTKTPKDISNFKFSSNTQVHGILKKPRDNDTGLPSVGVGSLKQHQSQHI